MERMELYQAFRSPPQEALREIRGGRLNGKTDINPMWRIKALTEQFGPCGVGWWYTIDRRWMEPGANGEIAAFTDITLTVLIDGKASNGIPGTGGSMFIAKEKGGLYTSDECYKMALTDAISVAAKALGVGADVYWDADRSKYGAKPQTPQKPAKALLCPACGKPIKGVKTKDGKALSAEELVQHTGGLCFTCFQTLAADQK